MWARPSGCLWRRRYCVRDLPDVGRKRSTYPLPGRGPAALSAPVRSGLLPVWSDKLRPRRVTTPNWSCPGSRAFKRTRTVIRLRPRRPCGAESAWICSPGEHREPVAMASFTPSLAGVSRIGLVYTPPSQRRRGFAAAITAGASEAAPRDRSRAVHPIHAARKSTVERHLQAPWLRGSG